MSANFCRLYYWLLFRLMMMIIMIKIWFLSTGTPWAADYPSLYQIWRKNVDPCRNYGPESKSKMAAVRHLGFVTSSYRTTHKVFSLGHIGLSNFMLIRCIVLKIWRFEIFADMAWNAYSRPQNFGFGAKIGKAFSDFYPNLISFSIQTPKVLTKFREDRLKNVTVSVPTDTYIHTYIHTQTKTDLIICPMLWYNNGTDNDWERWAWEISMNESQLETVAGL